jgi:hypothetical protein
MTDFFEPPTPISVVSPFPAPDLGKLLHYREVKEALSLPPTSPYRGIAR